MNENTEILKNTLVIVSAKEHGKMYHIKNSEISHIEYIAEHPESYSDDEGKFVRSADGQILGQGSVKEEQHEHFLKQYLSEFASAIEKELNKHSPDTIVLFEPEHLKGRLAEYLPETAKIDYYQYGNFVKESPEQIIDRVKKLSDNSLDPSHPNSVLGEENAAEKKKILAVGNDDFYIPSA